jgi:putative nucleotidyltransferase with HDIG domain
MLIGTSWYALGPALVLAASGDARPWWVWPLAFGAQIVADTAHTVVRERLAIGISPALSLSALSEVYAIDAMLSPVGLLAGLAAERSSVLVLAVLPLAWLLRGFARERAARIDKALELSAAYRGTALLLSEVVDADDAYTGFHSRGVVELATAVADELGLPPSERARVEFAALLHDIGKLKVPNEIVNKPGALSAAEWEIIRRHPLYGEAMLRGVGGMLAEVGSIVRAHHERWDGDGYPDGIAGQQIPIGARIICACDAYSAITTDRSYRPASDHAVALAELRRCAGTQFDPEVVDALLRVLARQGGGEGPIPLAA